MRKRAEGPIERQRKREKRIGLDPTQPDAVSVLTNVDLLYRDGRLEEEGNRPVPEQLIYADSPISLLLALRVAEALVTDDDAEGLLWAQLRAIVPGHLPPSVWRSAMNAVSRLRWEHLRPNDLFCIVENQYWCVHYVERTLEIGEWNRAMSRQWHHIDISRIGGTMRDGIQRILGDTFSEEITQMFSSWALINQAPFDDFLLGTAQFNTVARDYGFFGVDKCSHLLFPGRRVCFVSRRPRVAYDRDSWGEVATYRYRDGLILSAKVEDVDFDYGSADKYVH